MRVIPNQERPSLLKCGTERGQLESWLAFYRSTLLLKCAGLSLDQLKIYPIASSSLTLLGLVRHMTLVEQFWFDMHFASIEVDEYYKCADDHDADFNNLGSASLDEVVNNFHRSCARSDDLARGHDLDEMATQITKGREVDLRWIYIHMIEEYARHLGHADLLRELIDGETGY
jgi:uncharacterized damage-inducible protein DinB